MRRNWIHVSFLILCVVMVVTLPSVGLFPVLLGLVAIVAIWGLVVLIHRATHRG